MHESSPKPKPHTVLDDVIETPVGETRAGPMPTLGEALDAYRPPPEPEPAPEPLDPHVRQRVYLLAAVLTGIALATGVATLIALALRLRG